MTRNFDDDNKEPPEIIIQDLRHSREGGDEEDEQATQAEEAPEAADAGEPGAAEESASDQPVMEVVEPPQAEADSSGMHGHDHDQEEDAGNGQPQDPMEQAAMQQVMQIFEMGLDNYQKSQLGIYIQFALIYLGRMPHPVTGLVATDTDKARFAIDLLHVSFSHLESELQPQEKQEFQSVLAQLQMAYTQVAGNAPVPPSGTEPEA